MSIRQDKIQLIVEINGKPAGGTIKELRKEARSLKRAMDNTNDPKKAAEYAAELRKINDVLATARARTRGVAKIQESWLTSAKKGFTSLLPVMSAVFVLDQARRFFTYISNQVQELDLLNNKFQTVFGNASDIVSGFADRTAIRLGLTTREYKSLTAAAGDLLIPMEFQRTEAAKLSTDVVRLAGVYSAWTGGIINTAESSNILVKSLLGEREELKRYGVSIQEADIKQILFERGQSKLTGTHLQQAKALATLELLNRKSIDAQTSFEENSKGFIQTKARVLARIREVGNSMATLFLPAFERGFQILEKFLAGVINFTQGLRENRAILLLLIVSVATLNRGLIIKNAQLLISALRFRAVAKGAQNLTIAQRILNVVMKANPFGIVITLLASLAAGFAVAYASSENFRSKVSELWEQFISLLEAGKQLRFIGRFFEILAPTVQLISDLITNTSAAFAGLSAAGKQAIDNIKLYFDGLTASAKIFGLRLQRSLSISPETKQRLSDEIKALESLKTEAAESGKSIGEAYTEARDKVIAENQTKKTDLTPKVITPLTNFDLPDVEGPDKKKKTPEDIEREAKEKLDAELEANKVANELKLIELESRLLNELDTEEEFELKKLDQKKNFLNQRLEILRSNGQQESQLFRETELEILRADKEIQDLKIENRLNSIKEASEIELSDLQEKFLKRLITEEEYELSRLELLRSALEQRLEVLRELGLEETKTFRQTQNDQLKVQQEIDKKKLQNTQRTQEIKEKLNTREKEFLGRTFDFAIQNLARDEAARKKHASAIKAFEIAKVQVNLASEIQGIWKNINTTLGPLFGKPLAILETGLALARATFQTRKIAKTKFFHGGMTGNKGLYSDEFGEVAGVVHTDEWVGPKWMVNHPLYGSVIQSLENVRRNKGSFFEGGLTSPDTTPVGLEGVNISSNSDTTLMDNLFNQMTAVMTALSNFPGTLKAQVVHSEFETAAQEIGSIRAQAEL